MKVHRIVTTIEVENDNSITSVEVTNLHPTNADIPLAITNLTTNGNANDINKVYAIVDNHRLDIDSKLKDIARIIDDYECGIICINAYDDKYDADTDIEPDGISTALTQSGVRGESPIEPDGISKTS